MPWNTQEKVSSRQAVREGESKTDHYEDILGTYLVKLSTQKMGRDESEEATELLKTIGDFERISDHAVNILESAEELRAKGLTFSRAAQSELDVLSRAVRDILQLALRAFREKDTTAAGQVEPLEQVIDKLKDKLRTNHIARLQRGECSLAAGFVLSDLLTNLERVADHCSNIAVSLIETSAGSFDTHEYLSEVKEGGSKDYTDLYHAYTKKYALQ